MERLGIPQQKGIYMSEVVYGCVACDRQMTEVKTRSGYSVHVCSECFALVSESKEGEGKIETLGKCAACGHWEWVTVSEQEGHFFECEGCGAIKSIESAESHGVLE